MAASTGVAVGAAGSLVAMRRRAGQPENGHRPEPEDAEPDLPAPVRGVGAKGLGRRSLDALRVGVLVLDADDRPVLVNPAAKEMGLLRAGTGVGGAPGGPGPPGLCR